MMALQNYNGNFYNLVNDLIDGKADGKFNPSANSSYEINSDNFNGSVFQGLEDLRDQFWEKLIDYMHNENSNNNLSHYGIRESDFAELKNNKQTVFEFINNNADLVDDFLNNYIKSGDEHWNESLKKLVDFFRNYIDPNSNRETDLIEYDENGKVTDSHGKISNGSADGKFNFRIDDIVSGDAGNYFGTDNLKADASLDYKSAYNYDVEPNNGKIDANKTWVRPWFNIDGDTYKTVRKGDKILRVLNSKKNLQFTRYKENEQDYIEEKLKTSNKKNEEILSKYLRLIMPMYERIVEVEDLDRNFWVIAQVIGGISAYLFDDNSPIATMFSGILDEIVQLWENVAYLWVAMGLISQNPYYTDIKTLFIPTYNTDLMPYIKFDNFAVDNVENETTLTKILETCWEKLQSLKSQYNKSNLVIVPEIRCRNYYKNYYARVLYPGLIVYNRNFNSIQYYPFQINGQTASNGWVDIDLTDENDAVSINSMAMTEDENYYYFLDGLYNSEVKAKEIYKILIRTIPTIDVSINNFHEIILNNLNLDFIDVCSKLSGGNNNIIRNLQLKSTVLLNHENSKIIQLENTVYSMSLSNDKKEINEGYYQGELCSWIEEKEPKIDWSAEAQQISFNPQDYNSNISNINSFNSYLSSNEAANQWRSLVYNKSQTDLQKVGEGKLYFAHSNFFNSNNQSVFEAITFLSFAQIDMDNELKIYSFKIQADNSSKNMSEIRHPFVSASFNSEEGKESTSKLYQINYENAAINLGNPALYFDISVNNFKFQNENGNVELQNSDSLIDDCAVCGNLLYGSMRIQNNNGVPELGDFIIYCLDRACLGFSDSTDSCPYYYKCTINTVATESSAGIINCTLDFNDKSSTFNNSNSGYGTKKWVSNWNSSKNLNYSLGGQLSASSSFTQNLEDSLSIDKTIYKSMI